MSNRKPLMILAFFGLCCLCMTICSIVGVGGYFLIRRSGIGRSTAVVEVALPSQPNTQSPIKTEARIAPSNTILPPTATPIPPTVTPPTSATSRPTATHLPPTAALTLTAGDISFELQDPPLSEDRIGEIKFRLLELGYEICTVTSSFYNHQTEAAVRHFQAVNGLPADGIVGPDTWEALFGENALPAPTVETPELDVESLFPLTPGAGMASDGETLWIMDESGLINAFVLDSGEFAGFYMVQALPGEEAYQPRALWFDGDYLWIAQQGDADALIQAYDPAQSSPVEGLLKPVFEASAHFPAPTLYDAITSDGQRLWVITEDLTNQQVLLQPIDRLGQEAGDPIRLGMGSGYGFGYSLGYDPRSGRLWVTYADEIFGEQAIVWIDPDTGEVGQALGVCGQKMLFDGVYLWIANEMATLRAVDPATGEIVVQAFLDEPVAAMFANGSQVWILTIGGMLSVVTAPK